MKKKLYLLSGLLLLFLISTLTINFTIASDDDDDGIEDDFEDMHKRNISIEFRENETRIESVLGKGGNIDEIDFNLKYDEDGFAIEVSYESEFNSGSEKELEFEVVFHEIVEYYLHKCYQY
jgi:hypothetical protein